MPDYIDKDAAGNEAVTLAFLPPAITAAWIIGLDLLKSHLPPYGSTLMIMLALNYVALNLDSASMSTTELQTRIAVDVATVGTTILAGSTNYAFRGPPEPSSWQSASFTMLGIACITATIRAALFTIIFARKLAH